MKIREGFILSKVGNDTVAVATGELSKKFPGVVVLGGSGAFLWDKLSSVGGCDESGLLAALLEEYETDELRAKADISEYLKKLNDAGILEI